MAPQEVPQNATFIPAAALTPRQLEALVAYAKIGSQSEAAGATGMTISTFKNHLTDAYRRLDAAGGAIDAYRVLGWLRVPGESLSQPIVDLQQINALLKNANGALAELGEDLLRLADAADARCSSPSPIWTSTRFTTTTIDAR